MVSKNLNLCFIKRPETEDPPPPPSPSLKDLHHSPSTVTTATASSSSSSLLKTFNSMYDVTPNSTSNKSLSLASHDDDFSDSEAEPDFSTVFASTRFFFSSPGRSNSIVESSNNSLYLSTATSTTTSTPNSKSSSAPTPTSSSDSVIPGGVPIPTFSPDPYADFRRSMQEMVDDRKLTDVTSGWNYLHELLLCYLALNPKHTHKYIISAFADLLTSLTAAASDEKQETFTLNRNRNRKPEASSDRCTVE